MSEIDPHEVGGPSDLASHVYDVARKIWPQGGGVFFEAGANDGIRQSNSLKLEIDCGWHGILVEPSSAFELLRLHRSAENYFAKAALVRSNKVQVIRGFFYGNLTDTGDPSLLRYFAKGNGSFSPIRTLRRLFVKLQRTAGLRDAGFSKKSKVVVDAITLSRVIEQSGHNQIDIFILDIEGMELDALEGWDFQVLPRILIIETRARDAKRIFSLLHSNGYRLANSEPDALQDNTGSALKYSDTWWVRNEDDYAFGVVQAVLGVNELHGS